MAWPVSLQAKHSIGADALALVRLYGLFDFDWNNTFGALAAIAAGRGSACRIGGL